MRRHKPIYLFRYRMSNTFLNVLNDVYKNSLEDDEIKVYNPIDTIKVPLRRHQYSVIEKMKEYENDLLKGKTMNNHTLYSKYAILGDNVGVGKTLMVLGYIASIKSQNRYMPFTSFDNNSSKNG